MPVLELLHTRTFDADMDRLRQLCFPGNYQTGLSKDDFDDGSIHIVARADGILISDRALAIPTSRRGPIANRFALGRGQWLLGTLSELGPRRR